MRVSSSFIRLRSTRGIRKKSASWNARTKSRNRCFHLYDQTRPQGAPYPFTPNAPPFLPRDYRESAKPLGIVGGIEVECSPWIEDNLWVLMMIQNEPIIVGTVGNIDPAKPDFQEFLDRYHRNKLFLGIRYGNVWKGQDLVTAIHKPEVIDNMKAFARTGLMLEVANPRLDLIEATLRLTDKVPDLRIVLGHLQALRFRRTRAF